MADAAAVLRLEIDSSGALRAIDPLQDKLKQTTAVADRTAGALRETGVSAGKAADNAVAASTRVTEAARVEAAAIRAKLDATNQSRAAAVVDKTTARDAIAAYAEALRGREALTNATKEASEATAANTAFEVIAMPTAKELMGIWTGQAAAATKAADAIEDVTATSATAVTSQAALGGAIGAVLLASQLIIPIYELLTEKTRKLKEETKRAETALADLHKQQRLGIGGELAEQINLQVAAIASKEAALKRLRAAEGVGGPGEELGGPGISDALGARNDRLAKEIEKSVEDIASARLRLSKVLKDAVAEDSRTRIQDLASLREAGALTVANQKEVADKLAALRGNLSANIAAGGDIKDRLQLVESIKALTATTDAEKEAVKAATAARKAQNAENREALRLVKDHIALTNTSAEAEAARNNERNKQFAQTGVDAVAKLDAEIEKRNKISTQQAKQYIQNDERLAQLRAEVSLIGKNGDEREALIDAENRRAAIADGMNKAQAEEFVELQRAKREAEEFGSTLQTVLGIVQLVGGAFGDVGREIAKAATGAQSLIGGLEAASKLKDTSSFSAQLGAGGAIVGGASVLLEALASLDKSQQRNAERANALTKAFEEQIAAAADLSYITTETAAGIAATVAELQASAIAAFQAQVIAARGNGAAIREATTGLGDALKEIERLDRARTKALEEQARALKSFKDNNDVLRLRVQGRDSEADSFQTVIDIEEKVAAAVAKFGNTVEVAEYRLLLFAQAAKDAAEAEEERQREAARVAEEQRRRVFDLNNGTRAFTDPRGAGLAALDENAARRYNDAATAAEKLAVEAYNAAERLDYLAQQAEQDARTTESLIARILSASGDVRGAEDATNTARQRQEMADAIRDGMSEGNLALLRFTQFAERSQLQMQRAIEDGTKAILDQAKLEIAAIDDMIEAIQSVSAREIKALDDQIEATQNAAKATAKAFDLQIAAIREQTKAQIAAIDAQIESARDALDAAQKQLSMLEKSVQTNRQVVDALTQFRDSLKLGGLSTLSPEQKLAEARAQFERTSAAAQGGDSAAALRLPAAAQALLEASRAFNASGPGFVTDYNRVQAVVDAVERQFGATLPVQEQQLEAARAAVESLQQTIESLGEQKQAIQDSAEAQIEAIQKLKDKAAEDAQTVIERLTEQRDTIRDNAQKQIDKLNETKDAINAAAQRQIEQLVLIETAAHLSRLRQDEYWTTFLGLQNPNGGSGGDSRDRLRTGPTTAPVAAPVRVAQEQLAEARTQNRQVEQTNQRLAQVESLVLQLIDVIVAQSQQQVGETQQIVTAVEGVAAVTRDTGQAMAARR